LTGPRGTRTAASPHLRLPVDAAGRPTDAAAALRRCLLFSRLDETALEAIAGTLRRRRFRRGDPVFHAGDPGEAMFIIESGRVQIVLPAVTGASDAILSTLGPGAYFGELVLLDGAPRSASAIAAETTELLALSRSAFLDVLRSDPRLGESVMAGLASELRRLTADVEQLRFLGLPERVAARLARAAREADQPDGQGQIRVPWPHTQGELAAMVGATRPSVNRVLADLVQRGLIRFEDATLIVRDLPSLERETHR
jgi:CRP-like cAMP-binding protein